jgi:DNA-binding NtrC family response regulator
MVAAGDFREDLWFRINTFEIVLPPLRERIQDIAPLARHLAARFGRRGDRAEDLFSPEALSALTQHAWPGNVRELANVIEHALILCDQGPIRLEHLPQRFTARPVAATPARASASNTLRDAEVRAIQEALDRHNGHKPKAAEELGISLKTLYNKLNQVASLEKSA